MSTRRSPARDLLTDWKVLAGVILLAYVWQALLGLNVWRLTPGGAALSAWLPLFLAPALAVWSSARLMQASYGAEGRPAGAWAWRLVVGNLAVTLVQLLVFSLLVALGALLVFRGRLGVAGLIELLPIPSPVWFAGLLWRGYLMLLGLALILAALTQLAFIFSRLVDSFRWALAAWVFVLGAWIGLRVVPVVGEWLQFLPDFAIDEFYAIGDVFEFRTVLVGSGSFIASILFLAAVVAASAYLLGLIASDRRGQGAAERGVPSSS